MVESINFLRPKPFSVFMVFDVHVENTEVLGMPGQVHQDGAEIPEVFHSAPSIGVTPRLHIVRETFSGSTDSAQSDWACGC